MSENTSVETPGKETPQDGVPPHRDKSTTEPWKLTMSDLWTAVTGGRKPVAVVLVIVLFLIPAGWGVASFYWTTGVSAYERFFARSLMTIEEENFRNEWIVVVSYWSTEEAAREGAKVFKDLYLKYEDAIRESGSSRYPLWRDDIHVARDPLVRGRWIIGIDTFYGPSSEPVVSDELRRIARLGGRDPEAQNRYQRLFVGSRAFCYSQKQFEETYGKIDPPPASKKESCDSPALAAATSQAESSEEKTRRGRALELEREIRKRHAFP